MTLPSFRVYQLRGRRAWYCDTRDPAGERWQFSTGKTSEGDARAEAERAIRDAFGSDGGEGTQDAGAPTEPSPSSRPSLADRLRAARGGSAAPGGGPSSQAADDVAAEPEIETNEDAELIADVLSTAATLGWQRARAEAIRKKRWKDGRQSGHFEPGAPNEKCVLMMQNHLRKRLALMFGPYQMNDWIGIAVGAVGVAVTMDLNRERVVDDKAEAKQERQEPATNIRPERREAPQEQPSEDGDPTAGGIAIFQRRG